MKLNATAIEGVWMVDIDPYKDNRGLFARTWDPAHAKAQGLIEKFDYTCVSTNDAKGTLRGMHYQKDPHDETKLVRCTKGSVFDVVIDLRPDSKTYTQWVAEELSDENHRALYIPPGCAHGFISLSDMAEVLYHIAGDFVPESATGVRWDDPAFGIQWPMKPVVIADRDAEYSDFVL